MSDLLKRVLVPIVPLLLVLTPTLVRAQSAATASIEGTVVDESGAALPGVQVTATSSALQLPQVSATTDTAGAYQLRGLPAPGVYRIAFELTGFQTYVRADLTLPVGFAARVDVKMTIGALAETVSVSGASPVVDAVGSTRSTSLQSEELETLPVARTMQELHTLIPGLSMGGKPDVGDSNLAKDAPTKTYGATLLPTLNVEGINLTSGHELSTAMYLASYNFSEVQYKTTGNNADVAMPGFSMEAVIKSGANTFHGSALADYEHSSWQSNNITPDLEKQGLRVTNPLESYHAYAADIGGRLIRDKLWFYGGLSSQEQTTGLISFVEGPNAQGCWTCGDAPPAFQTTKFPQYHTKFDYQTSQKLKFNGVWVHTRKNLDASNPSATVPKPSTTVQPQTLHLTKGEMQWLASSRTVFSALAGYATSVSRYGAQPGMDRPGQPTSRENSNGLMTGPASGPVTRPSFRTPLKATLVHSRGAHELKFGAEYAYEGRSSQVPKDDAHGNYMLVFDRGQPFQIVTYNYPVTAANRGSSQALYAMDSWRLRRVTLNYGLRWDRYDAYYPDQHKPAGQLSPAADYPGVDLLTWTDFVPRVGAAWDLFGDARTVVKGTFGVFGDTMSSRYGESFNPNGVVSTTYRWRGPCVATGFNNVSYNLPNTSCDLSPDTLAALNPSSPDFVSIAGGLNNVVDPDLEQAKIYEYSARIEHELVPNVAVSAGYVYHRTVNSIYPGTSGTAFNIKYPNRPYSAYTIAVPLVDPMTGQAIDVYTYPASYVGPNFDKTMHAVSPDDRPDSFSTIEFTVTKRYSKRWNGSASFWTTKNHRWITPVTTSPNTDWYPLDETRNWEMRLAGLVRAPWDFEVSGTYRAQSGIYGQRTVRFTNALLRQGSVTIPVEPFGDQQGGLIAVANLKVARRFRFGPGLIEVNWQGFNLFNSSAATETSYLTGSTYGRVTGIVSPRVHRVAVEFQF